MTDEEIRVFIDGAVRYFDRASGQVATVETPYLKGDESISLEFTGVIGISGRHRGAVYYTAGSEMLGELLAALGEHEATSHHLGDLVGEMANTIAGNARRYYGQDFLISVPVVLRGRPEEISFPRRLKSFVVPIEWRGFRSFLIICLEKAAMQLGEG